MYLSIKEALKWQLEEHFHTFLCLSRTPPVPGNSLFTFFHLSFFSSSNISFLTDFTLLLPRLFSFCCLLPHCKCFQVFHRQFSLIMTVLPKRKRRVGKGDETLSVERLIEQLALCFACFVWDNLSLLPTQLHRKINQTKWICSLSGFQLHVWADITWQRKTFQFPSKQSRYQSQMLSQSQGNVELIA